MWSRRPLDWALSPATALPRVRAAARSWPSRSATTTAPRVSTGARVATTERRAGARPPERGGGGEIADGRLEQEKAAARESGGDAELGGESRAGARQIVRRRAEQEGGLGAHRLLGGRRERERRHRDGGAEGPER